MTYCRSLLCLDFVITSRSQNKTSPLHKEQPERDLLYAVKGRRQPASQNNTIRRESDPANTLVYLQRVHRRRRAAGADRTIQTNRRQRQQADKGGGRAFASIQLETTMESGKTSHQIEG